MSDQSLKALKTAIKRAYENQGKAPSIEVLNETLAKQLSVAVSAYVAEELKASGIVFEGGKLPEVVTRKGNLEGIATVALTAQLAEEANNALIAGFAEAALIASSSLRANTANFATSALTASYVKLVAGPNITINTASNGSIEITGSAGGPGGDSYWTSTILNKIFTTGSADIYGNLAVTGSVIALAGFSGSLTKLKDGVTNYIQAGPYITINTASNGSIQITGSVGGSSPEYWFSTVNNRTYTTGSAEIYANLVVTGSAFITGSVIAGTGFSGSLTKLKDGITNYLQAGPNITINTASDGSIQITGSAGGTGPQYWTSNINGNVFTTGSVDITGSLFASGSIGSAIGFTGSLLGTASYATQALSASYSAYALTASFATSSLTASYVLNAVSASFASSSLSSSYSSTASYVLQAVSASYASTASYVATSSYSLSALTASFATSSLTASYVLNAVSSSYSATASYVLNAVSASYAATASYVLNSVSSSYAATASYLVDTGFSGSITRLKDGTPYLLAGPNITLYTASNGSIEISASLAAATNYWISDAPGTIYTTGSARVYNNLTITGSVTQGSGSLASGLASHAEGWFTTASAPYSHAEGYGSSISTTAATGAHAEGYLSIASNIGAHAEGRETSATGQYSHAEGYLGITSGTGSHAEGNSTYAAGDYAHAEGYGSIASGSYSHAEGSNTLGLGIYSHTEGWYTTASAPYSHAEGYGSSISIATATGSHVEGYMAVASAQFAHAEGNSTLASGPHSHAEGMMTTAAGSGSHAEGYYGTSIGNHSHVEGSGSIAFADFSHAEGIGTIASGSGQLAIGKYNTRSNAISLFIIGDGTGSLDSQRHDFLLVNSGSVPGTGTVIVSGSVVSTLGFTGSLLGTASYATTASYVLNAVSSSYSTYALSASYASTASYVLNAISSSYAATASYLVDTGFSGSLTKLKDGTPYLLAGPNITINTASNGSVSISGSGVYAPNVGWVTAFEIDFASLVTQNLTGSTGTIFNGVQFEFSNSGNANWVGPSASLGFAINSKTTSTELLDSVRTAPLVNIVMTDLIGDYHPDDYDVRVWAQVTHNATNPTEKYFLGFERLPATTPYDRVNIARGYDSVQSSNFEVCYNDITAKSTRITSSAELADNTQIVTLDRWASATHYQTSGALGTFPASSSLKLLQYAQLGMYSDTRFTTVPMTGSNASVMFGAQTANTSGTYSVVFRNLRVEYRRRGGGTYVTGSFVYNYGGGGFWTSPDLNLINTTGSVSLTNGNLMVTGSVSTTLGFIGNLTGTASYATNALTASFASTASYVLQAVSASYASYALTASQAGVATNALTASYLVDTGFSGSITRLKDGTNYLLAGPNITITTNSNGAVAISASLAGATNYWQSNVAGNIFTTGSVDITGSLVVSGSITGSNLVLNGASSKLSAPNGNLIISSSNRIFITGSLFVSGSRSSLGIEAVSTLFDGDVFMSGGLGTSDYFQLKPVNTLRIPTNTTASYIYTSGSDNDMYFTQYRPETNLVNTVRFGWLESTLSTGLLYGGILSTANGTTTFSITSGSGLVISHNASIIAEPYPVAQVVRWPAVVSQSLTYITSSQTTYIGINGSGGIIQQVVPFAPIDYETYIPIGRILHQSGSVTNGVLTQPHVAYGLPGSHDVFIRAFGPLKLSGHVLAASGSTLGITKTGGESYVEGKNYTSNPSSPDLVLSTTDGNITVSKIFRVYVSGSTPVIDSGVANAGYIGIDPGHYNNNGVLDTVPSGQYSIHRVFWFPNSVNRAYFVYYGGALYNSIDIAQSAIPSEIFTEAGNTINAAILVGYIIAKGNATDLSNAAQARIVQGPLSRASTGGGGHAAGLTVPGGLDTYVQFNDGGSTFGGNANLTFNNVTNTLTTTNLAVSNIATVSGSVNLGDSAADIIYVSGSITASNGLLVTGSVTSTLGFSGSLTTLCDGTPYFLAGPNITLNTASNGSVEISASLAAATNYWTSNAPGTIYTTGSARVYSNLEVTGSLVQGNSGVASGLYSHAEGWFTTASAPYSHAEGYGSSVSISAATGSHAEGYLTIASAQFAHAEGRATTANGQYSHAEGHLTITSGQASHAEGYSTTATGMHSHAEGSGSIATGEHSHAEGTSTNAYNTGSHAEGYYTYAGEIYSHAEGWYTTASAPYSHAEGYGSTVSINTATGSHAEGYLTTVAGFAAHSEGQETLAEGSYSHAEGALTIASGSTSHAEGYSTLTIGLYSHAEGSGSIAYGVASHAEGIGTIASGSGQLTIGKYNTRSNTTSLFVIGDGTGSLDSERSDIVRVNSGSVPGVGTVEVTGSIVATLGFSGSHSTLKDGTPYLLAGPNISITTSSNGSIQISGTVAPVTVTTYWNSNVADYIFTTGSVDITGSLVASGSIRALTGFTGSLLGTASYASQAATASYVLQAVSSSYASTASYVVSALTASYLIDTGFSGSLTRLKNGTPYLVAGPNITITTASNGSVEITGSASGGASYWISDRASHIYTTGSVTLTGSLIHGFESAASVNSHAEGYQTNATAPYSHAEGEGTGTAGTGSHAEGQYAMATGNYSHAEGIPSIMFNAPVAQGEGSHAEGVGYSVAGGIASHVEGVEVSAYGYGAHAEGQNTTAGGTSAHAEGFATTADNYFAHSEGQGTFANGYASHAEGLASVASGSYSHAEGLSTVASGAYQHTIGKYNKRGNDFSLFVIGDGTGEPDASRGDIVRVNSGSAIGTGRVEVTGSIVATIGISGSHTALKDGTPYLLAGPNITITTNSNGAVAVSASLAGATNYWTSNIAANIFTTGSVDITGSLVSSGSIKALTGFSGSHTKLVDGTNYLLAGPNVTITTNSNGAVAISASLAGATNYWTSNVSANIFATGSVDITGSLVASGSIRALTGFTGSLTKLIDGTPYLLAGPNITINSSSNGAIQITGSAGSSGASYWTSDVASVIYATGSAVIYNGLTITGSLIQGSGSRVTSGTGSHAEGFFTLASDLYSHAEGWYTTASAPYSHAEGYGSSVSVASATGSHAEGYLTTVSAQMAHAEGRSTTADGQYSHAEGRSTIAYGSGSHAEGSGSIALADFSHAEGYYTLSSGSYSHSEGSNSLSVGIGSHAEGQLTTASGDFSHAEGQITLASGTKAHSEGRNTVASGMGAHAEGTGTMANNSYSHSEGINTIASGRYSHAEGDYAAASEQSAHAEGYYTVASGTYSHAEGNYTVTSGSSAHSEGEYTIASGQSSHAEGYLTKATGIYSHAEGHSTTASADHSHAEGRYSEASGEGSHAEGGAFYASMIFKNLASGTGSHAEGGSTTASGIISHAEGVFSVASGDVSHAEGENTRAIGNTSHSEGSDTIASGSYSHTEGHGTISSGSYQLVIGTYNKRGNTSSLFVVGDGTGDANANRGDILTVTPGASIGSGLVVVSGALFVTSGCLAQSVDSKQDLGIALNPKTMYYVRCGSTGAGVYYELPSAATKGQFFIKKTAITTGFIGIVPAAPAEYIEEASGSYILSGSTRTDRPAWQIWSDGAKWWVANMMAPV